MHVARWGCYLGGFVKKKKTNVTFFLPQNSLFRLKSPNVLCKQKRKKTKASALDFLCAAFIWTCLLVWRLIFFPFRRRLDGGFSRLSSRRKVRALNDWLSSIIQKVGNREGKLKMVNNNKIGWGLLGLGEIGPITRRVFLWTVPCRAAAAVRSILYTQQNIRKTTFFWLWRRTSRSSARNSIAYEEQIVNKTVGGRKKIARGFAYT
jgi:hypothetical protein